MKKLTFFFLVFLFITGCKQHADRIMAEAYHHKLYESEVMRQLPPLNSKEDTLLFMEQWVDDWILRHTLLALAKKELLQKEQEFSNQMAQYKEQLLINAYLQKISSDATLFEVSRSELQDFLNETKTDELPEYREMVKLNYVKLSVHSKLYAKIKSLIFSDSDRVKELQELEQICADTIEYSIDSDHWFYNDVIEKEFSFSISEKGNSEKIDFVQNGYRYLVLILDKKQQRQTHQVLEDRKMAQALLQQQKRAAFFSNFQDSVVQKAFLKRKVAKYPVSY